MVELTNRVFITLWTRLRRDEGQTFVEYAVLTAVVAIGIIAALTVFRTDLGNAFSSIASKITSAIG